MPRLEASGQTFDGTSLLPLWERLDVLEGKMEEADRWFARTNVLSDRRLDGAHRAGIRAYILANSFIGRARENHLLLVQTFTTPGVNVFPHATTNIIRPAFEAAARALWILDGEDAGERRLRGLRSAWEDHNESRKWAAELMIPLLMDGTAIEAKQTRQAAISKRYRDDASDLNLPWSRVTQAMNFRDEIGKISFLATDASLAAFLRAIWRRMSGVQHGMSYAGLLGSQRTQENAIPGGVEALLVPDDDSLLTECRASALIQQWALQRYIDRTKELSV